MHGDHDLVVDEHGFFVGWPGCMGDAGGVAEFGPEFFGKMRNKWRQDSDEAVELVIGQGLGFVDELEYRGDGGVEA